MKSILLAALLMIACNRQAITSSTDLPYLQGKMVKVLDGDTFDLLTDPRARQGTAETVRVRLDGIDCPEKNQPYGKEATQYLTDQISGKSLRVTGTKKDRDGRLIGTVFVAQKNVNQSLVHNGLAWHFTKYSKDSTLANLERDARRRRVGLWADAQPVAPWEWRKKKHSVKQ